MRCVGGCPIFLADCGDVARAVWAREDVDAGPGSEDVKRAGEKRRVDDCSGAAGARGGYLRRFGILRVYRASQASRDAVAGPMMQAAYGGLLLRERATPKYGPTFAPTFEARAARTPPTPRQTAAQRLALVAIQ